MAKIRIAALRGKALTYAPDLLIMANNYIKLLKKNCTHCEVNYLCMRCYIYFARSGKFEINNDFCAKKKFGIKKVLEELIEIEEKKIAQGAVNR